MTIADDLEAKDIICEGGMPGYLALPPRGNRRGPAVILLHERYGLAEHPRDVARRFARSGYVCLAPNIFYKHPDQAALHRGDAHYDITDPESAVYLNWALDTLQKLTGVESTKVAIMGVCQTGRQPLVIAAERPIGAALIWYGGAAARQFVVNDKYPEPYEQIISRSKCPILGIFGESDHRISVEDLRNFRNCLERYGRTFTIKVYPGAPHGFLNDTMPGRFRQKEAAAAWAAQLQFLEDVFLSQAESGRIVQRYELNISAGYDFSKNVRLE
jgi:carboxymethylenebutenolidase